MQSIADAAEVAAREEGAKSFPESRRALEQVWTALATTRTGDPPAPPAFPFTADEAQKYAQSYARWAGLPLELELPELKLMLRLIPPGSFRIGSPADEPGHNAGGFDETYGEVTLTQPYYLADRETTVGQFRAFVESETYQTDGERNGGGHAHNERAVWEHHPGTSWRKPGFAGPFELKDEHPVVHVSHNDALAFCAWLNRATAQEPAGRYGFALPSEAEWEWAARGGAGGRFAWGDAPDETGKRLNAGDVTLKRVHPEWPREVMPMDDGHAFLAPVASYQANAWGLHDMQGNVWELCGSRFGPYPTKKTFDPVDLSADRGFAVRGGGWSNVPHDVRLATRNADPPKFCHSNLGFRITWHVPLNLGQAIEPGLLPTRVHACEDYETEIERKWWLRGEPVKEGVPASLSRSLPNKVACRSTDSHDFDNHQGNQGRRYNAAIFNPVPGPPMSGHTRLAFRYRLHGTTTLRVQLYSLSNNYHRHLVLLDLPRDEWQSAAVDFTAARRPDGSGGPLAEDERIDDIQFYVEPHGEVTIDNIVLYEAAPRDERRPFPRRVIFTGWFDTGQQGAEWPGDFEIVAHDKPLTWDAARTVKNKETGLPWLRVSLRGMRPLSLATHVRFRYLLSDVSALRVVLRNSESGMEYAAKVARPASGIWSEAVLEMPIPAPQKSGETQAPRVDEIRFLLDRDVELRIDDLLIYEPGESTESS